MVDIHETSLDHVAGEDFISVYSSERKWINKLQRLKEQYPSEVDIRHINDDGSMLVRLPAEWFRLRPKKKVNLTEEQIEASKARLEKGRLKRLNRGGDDAQIGTRKE